MKAALLVKAWNAFASGNRLKTLKWVEDEAFPEFIA
jgi:hypothetical protein